MNICALLTQLKAFTTLAVGSRRWVRNIAETELPRRAVGEKLDGFHGKGLKRVRRLRFKRGKRK